MEYRKTSHAIYDLKYHIVWITKYRKGVLRGEIGLRARVDPPDLRNIGCEDRERTYSGRPYSPTGQCAAQPIGEQLGTTIERTKQPTNAGGIW